MVYDQVNNLKYYLRREDIEPIQEFLEKLDPEMREGRYEIAGERIYARVLSYPTKVPSECWIEVHKKYMDIQMTLQGAEGISVFPTLQGVDLASYDEAKDVAFLEEKECACAHTNNIPGFFTLLLPCEPHRPEERVEEIQEVKKLVIKVLYAKCYMEFEGLFVGEKKSYI